MKNPIRPIYSDRSRIAAPIFRAATALALVGAGKLQTPLKDILKQHWPDDRNVEAAYKIVTRAVTAPADTTTAGWASDLVGMGVADITDILGPASTFATLCSRGVQFRFDGTGVIQVHGVTASAANAAFVVENGPFPAMQLDLSSKVLLAPRKIGTVAGFSREALSHTTPNLELLVRQVLTESIGLALDSAMLDATAGSTARPAGLRNGINAEAESAEAVPEIAMAADVSTLVTAVAAIAGNNPIIFVASPAQAAALRLWAHPGFNYEVLSSAGLAAGVVVAIASNALVSACDPMPRFQLAPDAVMNFDNATPQDIGTNGVVAAGLSKSVFQSDGASLRAIMEVSWGLRNADGLAWVENVLW